jgi:nucleotide-binding universal stress UspA family protein
MVVAQNRPQSTEVRVTHVVAPIEAFSYTEIPLAYVPKLEEVRKERLKQAQELVSRAARQLQDAGFKVETVVREGDIRTEIIDIAAEWQADLIIVGSHGRKGVERFLLGSVSEFVARYARCSVEIVRIPANP